MATIKWETANNMMNIAAFIATRACSKQGAQIDLEAIEKFARDTFQEYCDISGITEVEEPEEENSEAFDDEERTEERTEDEDKYCDSAADDCFCNSDDEDEDEDSEEEVDDFGLPTDYWSEFDEDNGKEDDDNNTVYSLTAKGEFVLRYMQYGHSLEEASKIADILFGEGE